jgi:hypothetical protein
VKRAGEDKPTSAKLIRSAHRQQLRTVLLEEGATGLKPAAEAAPGLPGLDGGRCLFVAGHATLLLWWVQVSRHDELGQVQNLKLLERLQ